MFMTSFDFTSEAAKKLWERASPKGHKTAFAWRESPAGVDRAVTKVIRPMNEEQIEIWLADCMLSADIQSRYRGEQIKAGESLGRPKGLAVWVNDGDWGVEIGSTGELKQKQNEKNCKCGKPVQFGGNINQCLKCYECSHPNIYLVELRDQYRKDNPRSM